MKHPNTGVRIATLASISQPPPSWFIDLIRSDRLEAIRDTADFFESMPDPQLFGQGSLIRLMRLLDSPLPSIRAIAVSDNILRSYTLQETDQVLLEALQDESESVRLAATKSRYLSNEALDYVLNSDDIGLARSVAANQTTIRDATAVALACHHDYNVRETFWTRMGSSNRPASLTPKLLAVGLTSQELPILSLVIDLRDMDGSYEANPQVTQILSDLWTKFGTPWVSPLGSFSLDQFDSVRTNRAHRMPHGWRVSIATHPAVDPAIREAALGGSDWMLAKEVFNSGCHLTASQQIAYAEGGDKEAEEVASTTNQVAVQMQLAMHPSPSVLRALALNKHVVSPSVMMALIDEPTLDTEA